MKKSPKITETSAAAPESTSAPVEISTVRPATMQECFDILNDLASGKTGVLDSDYQINRLIYVWFMGPENLRVAKDFCSFCTGKAYGGGKMTVFAIQHAFMQKLNSIKTTNPSKSTKPMTTKTTKTVNAAKASKVTNVVTAPVAAPTTNVIDETAVVVTKASKAKVNTAVEGTVEGMEKVAATTTKAAKTSKAPKTTAPAPVVAPVAPVVAPKAAKKEKAPKAPKAAKPVKLSTYGVAVDQMCVKPDCTFPELVEMVASVDPALVNTSALRTAYAAVRSIVGKLRANGKMSTPAKK